MIKVIKKLGHPIILFTHKNRKILFFGSRHSWNPNNKQVKLIKNILKRFKPELIMLETTKIIEHKNLKEAIMKKGEVGLLEYLAKKNNIKAIAAEPKENYLARKLLKKYTKEALILFFVLRTLDQYPKMKIKPKFKNFVNFVIKEYKFLYPHLSYGKFKKIFTKLMGKRFDEKELGKLTKFFDPNRNLAVTNAISRDASAIRDIYTLNMMKKAFTRHNKIMIVKGCGHANFFEENFKKIK
jgi:hypothetical protein